jgi:hypothetical protein
MTLTASVDAFGGMVKAAKQIVSIGALAASGIGAAAGAGAGAAGAGTAGAAQPELVRLHQAWVARVVAG